MEAFITALVERIPNEDTFLGIRGKFSLVGAEAMDKSYTSIQRGTSGIRRVVGYDSFR